MQLYFPLVFYNASPEMVIVLLGMRALRSSHIIFRHNLAAWLCEYEKYQQKYFNCLPGCDTKRTELSTRMQERHKICITVICTNARNVRRESVLRAEVYITLFTTNGVSNCAIDNRSRSN